jgi:hypothetical protein
MFDFDFTFHNSFWIAILIGWISTSVIWSYFMWKVLTIVQANYRTLSPELAWLSMIPLFCFYWNFMVAFAVSKSLRNEFAARGIITREPRPGYSSGLSANILFCFVLIPPFGILLTLISYLIRIGHLVRVHQYTLQLKEVILTQAMYAEQTQNTRAQNWSLETIVPDEVIKQNDPTRFIPQANSEEDLDRWRKKN